MKRTLWLFLLLFSASSAQAEVITLKTGKVLEGKIIGYNDDGFKLQTKTNYLTIPYKSVGKMESSLTQEESNPEYTQAVLQRLEKNQENNQRRQVDRIERIQSKKVEFYMTSWCGYCQKMDSFLQKVGANYVRYNIDADGEARRRFQALGGRGIPLVKIGNTVIRGYDPDAVWRALVQ